MACSATDHPDAGYATPLAMAVCMAVTITTGALAVGSVSELKLARRDLERQNAEYVLAGELAASAILLMEARGGTRLQWTRQSGVGAIEVLAEAEAAKASYASGAEASAAAMTALSVNDSERVRRALRSGNSTDVGQLDGSPLWTLCAPSLLSPYGLARAIVVIPSTEPTSGRGSARLGQLWRLRVSGAGWVDERIVRFTGNQRLPAATVERRFFRGERVGSRCDQVFDAVAAAD